MILKRLTIFLLIAISYCLYAKERIPGTKVKIDSPAGFVKATQFPGYIMESMGSAIIVTPVPGGPFSEVSKGYTHAGLATQGMNLLEKEERKVGSADAILVHVSQSANGTEFLKWILVFGDNSETNIVVASFPLELEELLSEKLKESVLSSEWEKSANLDFFEGLTFNVSESGVLKFANKIGNNVLLSENGVFPLEENDGALVIVGSSISQGWKFPENKKSFSTQRLRQIDFINSPRILEEKNVKIDGLDGYLIYATGTDQDSGGEMYIEQCLLFTNDGYYIFQAMVGSDQQEKFKASFLEILESFKRK